MGNVHSCTSKGALLLVASANGDLGIAQELLAKYPKAASYYNFKDRSSPLLQAAARGHFELVQLILETAVMTEGPERAKKNCIDHANSKRQTALMVACKHGHPDCVEYLVTNGGDPLLTDERRHNTCLHFAALYGHSECVHKLLRSPAAYRVQGRQVPVAQIPCVDDGVNVKFIDRHNGWGLSALHIAVFQGSVSTVRALLRHGADVESVIHASKVENSPIRCAVGSNALHIAALTGNIVMAKLILETQESYPGLELRRRSNAAGLKPYDYAQSARNPVLMHLLDERLPVTLLRQIWMNYSLEQSLPPRHQTLGSMLQKLKLMFNLELIAIQRNVTHIQPQQDATQQQQAAVNLDGTGQQQLQQQQQQQDMPELADPLILRPTSVSLPVANGLDVLAPMATKHRAVEPANARLLWARRQDEITQLLSTVAQLHDKLKALCRRDEPAPGENTAAAGSISRADRAATYEAVLDFILSTLITPRTVSAILHAAKKLVSASVNGTAAMTAGRVPPELPPGDSDSQHGLALLSTALRAVETCLQAAVYLTSPAALEEHIGASNNRSGSTQATPSGSAPGEGSAAAAADPVVARTSATAQANISEGAVIDVQGQAFRALAERTDTGSVDHRQGLGALVSDLMMNPLATAVGGNASQGSPRAAAAGMNTSPLALGGTGFIFPQGITVRGASAGDGSSATPAFATHWSAHLHTLIAQLQWDIGVQRHRRRRAHAAAAAARNTATATAVVAATSPTPMGSAGALTPVSGVTNINVAHVDAAGGAPSGSALAIAPVVAAQSAILVAAAAPATAPGCSLVTGVTVPDIAGSGGVAGIPSPDAAAATASTVNLLRVLNSRRGDAVQDIVTSQSSGGPAHRSTLSPSRSESGISTPPVGATITAPTPADTDGPSVAASVAGAVVMNGDDGWLHNGAAPVQTDEIIPLVSAALPHVRMATILPPGGGARDGMVLVAEDPLSTGGTTGPSAATLNNTGTTSTTQRAAAVKEPRGKDRDGAGGGGLDGPDDSPAASESGSDWSDDDRNVCSICMDLPVAVLVAGCQHGLCVQCAFQLCIKGRELPSCPFCRQKIGGFEAKEVAKSTAAATVAAASPPTAAAAAGVMA